MTPVYAAAILFGILAVSEVIGIVSKAWIPSMLVAFLLYLALLWSGLISPDLLKISTLGPAGGVFVGAVIAHMGTMIPISQTKAQWRSIVIGLVGVAGATALILAVASPLFGYQTAAASVGPVAGGIVAFLISSEKLKAIGHPELVVVPALVLAIQSLIGMPIANVMLRKYAKQVLERNAHAEGAAAKAPEFHPKVLMPKSWQQPTILVACMIGLGALATFLDKLTGLNYGVWALLLGLAAAAAGLVPEAALEEAKSFGLAMPLIIMVVLGSMNSVTPAMLKAAIGPALVVLGLGAAGIFAAGWVISKLVKWSPLLGIPVALTALFGFPADYLLCQEISRSLGRDEDQQKEIMSEIYTPMLIGGFTTVTISSVVLASVLMATVH